MKRILNKDIVDHIYLKYDKAISKRKIYYACKTITDELQSSLENNEVVSISNFGTFATYFGRNLNRTKMRVENFRAVKFHPHYNFKLLLKRQASGGGQKP